MFKGVSPKEYKEIQRLLKPFMKEYDFFIYGSRVKGTHTPVSDLDILLKGKQEMPASEKESLKSIFDASHLPYIVNFTDYYSVEKKFYKLIQKDLIKISLSTKVSKI